jgi:hypothetical protein
MIATLPLALLAVLTLLALAHQSRVRPPKENDTQ